jgi:hypothetical protein
MTGSPVTQAEDRLNWIGTEARPGTTVMLLERLRRWLRHRWLARVPVLFRSTWLKSPAIEAESYVLRCGRYIERNPLAAGMVALPWEYRWSSAAAYALGQEDTLLLESPWYEELGASASRRQELWRSFLLGEDAKEEAIRRGDWVLGSEALCQGMGEQRGRPVRRRGRPRKLQSRRITSQAAD